MPVTAPDALRSVPLFEGMSDHGPRTATVTAVEPIEGLTVSAEDFGHLMDAHPAVRLAILTALTHRIRRQAAAISD